MKFSLKLITALVCTLPALVMAGEFPTGTFKGAGFLVEKGTLKMSHRDLFKYESSVTIEKSGENEFVCTISATLQKSANTPAKKDLRKDTYSVQWTSENAGTLVNQNPLYKKDRSTFSIQEGQLIIKSWIDRNQLWETHIYSIKALMSRHP